MEGEIRLYENEYDREPKKIIKTVNGKVETCEACGGMNLITKLINTVPDEYSFRAEIQCAECRRKIKGYIMECKSREETIKCIEIQQRKQTEENDKDKPKKHIAIPARPGAYIWVCPVCKTQISGYPIEGYRCKKCNQIIDFE